MTDRVPISHSLATEPLRPRPVAIVPSANRTIVLLMGTPGSGVSVCARVLRMLGVDMPDTRSEVEDSASRSPDQHVGSSEIVDFHDRILELFDRQDHSPLQDFPLPTAWWMDPRSIRIRRELSEFVNGRLGEECIGFSDPRLVHLMPIWHHIIHQHELTAKILFCLRNPTAPTNHDESSALGEYRWLHSTMEFFKQAKNYDICIVDYENWLETHASNVEKISRFIEVRRPPLEMEMDAALSNFLDPLRGLNPAMPSEARDPLVRSLYDLAKRSDRDSEARKQIDDLVSQFSRFQHAQQPFLRSLEGRVAAAAKLPLLERDAAELRAVVEHRTALITSAIATANTAEAGLAKAVEALERQRVEIAEALRERDEQRLALESDSAQLAALQSAVAELREREAALVVAQSAAANAAAESASALAAAQSGSAALQSELQSRTHALQAACDELRGAQSSLATSEQALSDRLSEANQLREQLASTKDEVAAQGHIVTEAAAEVERLRQRLALTEAEVTQRDRSLSDRTLEIDGFRRQLTEAQTRIAANAQELTDMSATLAEQSLERQALEVQLRKVDGALALARDVGAAMIAVLATPSSQPPTKAAPPATWRDRIRRFLLLN